MDPNANLAEQSRYIELPFGLTGDDAARLSELRDALSEWIARGGFEPDWTRHPAASALYQHWTRTTKER